MKTTKIAEIERLIEKYKERIKVINSMTVNHNFDDLRTKEIDTLETVIEDLENILN